jgi:HK97 family phage major capsid protein
MADIDEVKTLFAETQKTVEATKAKVAEMEGKSADYVDQDSLKKMKSDLADQIAKMDTAQAELKARVDQQEIKGNRPGAAKIDTPEAKAMDGYMRKGVEPPAEMKSMSTGSQVDGGYLVPDVVRDGIQARLRRTSPMRQLATIVSLQGDQYQVLVERGDAGYQWAGETQSRDETGTPDINRISISQHELSAMPKVSQRLLDNATFDVEAWLTAYVAGRFARAEATAFLSGNGVDKPKGFLAYSKAATADDTRAAEALQYRATGVSGGFAVAPNAADVLVRTFYDLQGEYQSNASWMAKNTTMAEIAVLKDSDGGFLLRDILNADGTLVRTIMGRAAFVADDMPAIAADSYGIAVGDFAAGYTIVDGQSISLLRDPFTAKPNVLFYTTKRVGGGVTDFDAIKLIKFGTS